MKLTAHARVQILVEVREAAWGGDCSIEQLYSQAAEGGVQKLAAVLREKLNGQFVIIGEPKVIGVITENG